jgi:hypothetical protein
MKFLRALLLAVLSIGVTHAEFFNTASTLGIRTTTAIDKFATNGALSGNWTVLAGFGTPNIVSGAVQVLAVNTSAHASYTAKTFSSNQFAQVTIASQATSACINNAQINTQSSGANWYEVEAKGPIGTSATYLLDKVVAGTVTVLATYTAPEAVGDTITVADVNGTLTAYRNSVAFGAGIPDATFTGGSPGAGVSVPSGGSLSDCSFSSFAAGNVNIPYVSPSGTPLLTYLTSLESSGNIANGSWADLFGGSSGGTYGTYLDMFQPASGATTSNYTIGNCASSSSTSSCTSGITNTGVTPAILAVQLAVSSGTPGPCGISQTLAQGEATIEGQLASGGIALAAWTPVSPVNGSCSFVSVGGEFPNVLQSGGICSNATCNAYFYGYGCTSGSPCGGAWGLAQALNTIAASNPKKILLRFLHENNLPNNGYWWGTNGTSGTNPTNAQFVTLFQQTVTYLRSQGVNNVLYIYCMNWFSGAYSTNDPGASYRDLISIDMYGPITTSDVSSGMAGSLPNGGGGWAYANSLGIPVLANEVGSASSSPPSEFSYDSSIWNNAMQGYANGSNLVATIPWAQTWCLQCQLNAAGYMSNSISRSQLPTLQ